MSFRDAAITIGTTLLTLSALVLVLAGMIRRNEVRNNIDLRAEFDGDEPEAGRFI